MKPLSISILSTALAISIGCAIGCDASAPDSATGVRSAPVANTQTATFFVEGMI